jgi:hypothetical protein
MKLEKLALSRKNEWWFDLLVEKEVQDYLVGKLASLTKSLNFNDLSSIDPTYILYKEYSSTTNNSSSLVFANSGGRALEHAGPYKDLRGMIHKYMTPWRKDRILHIGFASEASILFQQRKYRFAATSTKALSNININGDNVGTMYMQWCKRSEELLEYIANLRHMNTDSCTASGSCSSHQADESSNHEITVTRSSSLDSYFMSADCDTVWYGHFISAGRIE